MEKKVTLDRRGFLRATAVSAVAVLAGSCAQPTPVTVEKEVPVEKIVKETVVVEKQVPVEKVVKETVVVEKEVAIEKVVTATPIPAKFKEAPQLAEMVKAGKLPPVDERLPAEPRVVPVVEEIGAYGGTIRQAFIGPSDSLNWNRFLHDGMLFWTTDGTEIIPQAAKGWEMSGDLKTVTMLMRKGLKWSDGQPFTADDVMFWWEGQIMNDEMTPSKPSWAKIQGELGAFKKVDDYSFAIEFAHPYPLVIEWLSFAAQVIYAPKHYMSQFHPGYTKDQAALDKAIKDAGFEKWNQLYGPKNDVGQNPERPQITPWIPNGSTRADQRFLWKRNPYYYGVDPEGNQLPYVDELVWEFVSSSDLVNLKAASGEIDFQSRHIVLDNYPLFVESQEKGDYRILFWPCPGGTDAGLFFNQSYSAVDPAVAEWLSNRDFRIALSYAINREELIEALVLGLGEPRQMVPRSVHPFYPGDEYAYRHTEFDPAKANQMLDSMGLDKKDSAGFRLRPDGQVLTLSLLCTAAFGAWPDVGELVAKDWNAVGVKAVVDNVDRALYNQRQAANEWTIHIWSTTTIESCFTSPNYTTPSNVTGPLCSQWLSSGGEKGVEPPEYMKRLVELHEQAKGASDAERAELGKEVFRIVVDELYVIGTFGLTPMINGTCIVKNKLRNVPETAPASNVFQTPGNGYPEQFFWRS